LLVLLLGVVSGCANRRNSDLLESRLRMQEDSLREMESKVASARSELAAARMESDQLRNALASQGKKPLLSEQAQTLYSATEIQIDKLRSGGLDNDGRPGDDMVTAAILPRDRDGELVKLAGTIELELFDLAKPNDRQRVGKWTFDANQSSEHWHRGFLGSGYFFKLPWQQAPENSQLVLRATLTAPDGRRFDASETIRVALAEPPGDKATGIVKSSAGASPRQDAGKASPTLSAPAIQPTAGRASTAGRATVKAPQQLPAWSNDPNEPPPEGEIQQLNYTRPNHPAPNRSNPVLDLSPGNSGDRKGAAPGLFDRPPSGSETFPAPTTANAFKPESLPTRSSGTSSAGIPDWASEDADLLDPRSTGSPKPRTDRPKAGTPAAPSETFRFEPGANLQELPGATDEVVLELEPDDRGDRKARANSSLPSWTQ
jgi:hypothetical protein